MSKEFMLDGANLLKNVFGAQYPNEFKEIERATAFIGGGTGFIATTLLYSLAPSLEDGKMEIQMSYRYDISTQILLPITLIKLFGIRTN